MFSSEKDQYLNVVEYPGANIILRLQGLALIVKWRLKEGGFYFKVSRVIHIKFIIISFQVTTNNYRHDM